MSNLRIVNRVINLLGRPKLTAISDDDWGNIIDDYVDDNKNIILERYEWSFARRYVELSKLITTVSPKFECSYQIPEDCIRINNVYPFTIVNGVKQIKFPLLLEEWISDGNSVSTNVSENVMLDYQTANVDANIQKQSFIDCLAYYVASEVSIPLTENPKLASTYAFKYEKKFTDAVILDQTSENEYEGWANPKLFRL